MGYQLIETVTVGSGGAASIEFTGIDQTGQDLVILLSSRGGSFFTNLQLNSDTSSNYSNITLRGSGSSVSSASETTTFIYGPYNPTSGATANTFSSGQFYISNYAGAANKSVSVDGVYENNATGAWQVLTAGLWSNTSAVTSAKVFVSSGTFVQYNTASIYLITAD